MILKKSLATSAIILSSTFIYAQNSNPFSANNFEFLGGWKANTNNSNLVISSGFIKNNTNTTYNIEIEYYLIPYQEDYTKITLSNPVPVSVKIGNINAHSLSNNQTKVEVDINTINNLKFGTYRVIALLKDRTTGENLGNKIFSEVLTINTSTDNNAYNPGNERTSNISETTNNKRRRDKNKIEFAESKDQILLNGEWKLDIDFQTLLVKLNGNSNDIINNTDADKNDLKLYIYFVEKLHTDDENFIEGYEIIDANLNPILARGEFKNLKLEASISEYIPSGEYYPILLISEKDTDGIYKIKSFIQFENKYVL